MKKTAVLLWVLILGAVSGCGYTTHSRLPENIKAICIQPVKSNIDLSAEVTDKDRFRVYRPGVEVDLTNAIINRFIFDGTLKVTKLEKANAVVEATLVDYRRDALRYTEGDDIQEYRLSIVMDVKVIETSDQKVLWHETVVGDTSFFLSGARAMSEDDALTKAVDDVARRVVEKTIEVW